MSDPTEDGNKTVFRPSPLQGRKLGQTNFPGQNAPTRPGIDGPPPVPQQPVWNTGPAQATSSAPHPSIDDSRGTTALAPGRPGGSVLPFVPVQTASAPSAPVQPAPVQPAPARSDPVRAAPIRPAAAPPVKPVGKRVIASDKSARSSRRSAGGTIVTIVLALVVLVACGYVALRLLAPDRIPPQLRLSGGGVEVHGATAPVEARG